MDFKLPIVGLLDSLPSKYHNEMTMLGELITRLYLEADMSQKTIAMLLCVSESTVWSKIPKDLKDKDASAVATQVKRLHNKGKVPKEIAYEMSIPINKVYAILKRNFNA